MKKRAANLDLLHGSIAKTLVLLSLPIIGTALVQMTYSLVDLMWIGRLGAGAIAAVGAAGFYMWMAIAVLALARTGGNVYTGQQLGAKDIVGAKRYAASSLQLTIGLGLVYGIGIILFVQQAIGFFSLPAGQTQAMGESYLQIVAAGFIFTFVNMTLSSLSIATGDSRTPLITNTVGLVLNMVLDPLLIFTAGLGVDGAAIATVVSQAVVTGLLYLSLRDNEVFTQLPLFTPAEPANYWKIIKLGVPMAIQTGTFCGISMIIARFVASFGEEVMAAQRVGVQIESMSWLVADAFGVAISSFVAQNIGANQFERTKRGYFIAIGIMTVVGISNTFVLYLGAEPFFSIFTNDPAVIEPGANYLRIIAYSQWFMCIEIVTTLAFAGYGLTGIPSTVKTIFLLTRIPASLYLMQTTLGVSGIWWSISMSSVGMSLFIVPAFFLYLRKQTRLRETPVEG